jgi:hypothetical protein
VGLEQGPLRSYLEENVAAPVWKAKTTAVGIRHADNVAPSIRKSWHYLRRQAAVGIISSRTQAKEFLLVQCWYRVRQISTVLETVRFPCQTLYFWGGGGGGSAHAFRKYSQIN